MIGETLGRFRIVAPLGRGGMASVWRAEDPLLGRDVAIKVIADSLAHSPAARARFLIEAENGRKLDHPSIVPVLDFSGEGERLWIAFDRVDGETLADRIARAPMDPREAARIVADAADAIAHAHERGVLHRDVSTRNIMVGRDGRVFVLDFGLSRALDQESFTSSGVLMGTPHFLSPEVVRGERATEASDVWGLGIVLYEALTGSLPFRHDQQEALLYAILNEPIMPPSGVRAGLASEWDLPVVSALAREGQRRPSPSNISASLRSIAAKVPPSLPEHVDGPIARVVSHIFLAVLPFDDLHAEAGEPPLGRTLALAIASALRSGEKLTVIDTSGSNESEEHSLETLARRIGANRILRGNVRRAGADLRVTWRLVDPFSLVQIAGDSVDGRIVDLFALEDRLIDSVARGLNLPPGSRGDTQPRRDPAARERFQQALGYLQRHDHAPSVDGAIAILERLVSSEGESAERLGALGRAYLLKRRLTHERIWETRAASVCERAISLDPDSVDVRLTLAELQLETGQLEAALQGFEQLVGRRPGLEAWVGLGRTLEALGRASEAEEAFKKAIEASPNAWNGHQWLGLLYFHLGRYADAITTWRWALRRSPDNARLLANLGAAYFQLGRADEAISACEQSVRIEPTPRAYYNLGAALFSIGKHGDALDALERAAALQPGDPDGWGNLGSACRLVPGHEARAKEALENAVLLARTRLSSLPRDALMWGQLSGWLANLERYEEAHEAIERALDLAPDDPILMQKAIGAYQRRQPELAISWLRRAIARGYDVATFLRDPAFRPLRETPQYAAVAFEFRRTT